jgi:uncharacterized protein YqjF (DUF2071 family)
MEFGRIFLAAEWRNLVMLNYRVDPGILERFVPRGTAVDSFQGSTYISVVGFQFLRTRLFGRLAIPFHANFDEVNLRFYVRRKEGEEARRGVVFVKEIVPRRAIAAVARFSYDEKYVSVPMRQVISAEGAGLTAEYRWKFRGRWYAVRAEATNAPILPAEGSVEQFITEHYWGYTRRRDGQTVEYRVSHVPWRVWSASKSHFESDAGTLYGPEFKDCFHQPPASAFIAEGSAVSVHFPRRLAL